MPRSSGVFTPASSSVYPAVSGTIIDPTDFNALVTDLVTAINDQNIINKTTDETTNTDTTFSDDAKLLFAVAASTKYRFRFTVFYDTPAAADFKWQLAGPAAATLILYNGHSFAPGATSATITRDTAFSSSHTLTETSGTKGYIRIDGILQNGLNAGNVSFQWAQDTSNGSNTTVYAGSYLEFSVAD